MNRRHIHKIINTKNKKFKRYLKTKRLYDYRQYQSARNKTKNDIKRARKEHESKIADCSKDNPKRFWRYLNESAKSTSGISALKTQTGSLASSDQDKAQTLNSFFSSVFTNENVTNIPDLQFASLSKQTSCNNPVITPEKVLEKLTALKTDKAYGPDGIPPLILFELREQLASPLSILFNSSINTSQVPNDWRTALVTAIFKKGSRSDPGNYRPVSLTCIVSKLLESFVRDCLDNHMEKNQLYSNSQHGFRKGRSCQTQLLEWLMLVT